MADKFGGESGGIGGFAQPIRERRDRVERGGKGGASFRRPAGAQQKIPAAFQPDFLPLAVRGDAIEAGERRFRALERFLERERS